MLFELDIDEQNEEDKELLRLINKKGTDYCKGILYKVLKNTIKKKCNIPGCTRESEVKGLCRSHYNQYYNGYIDIHGKSLITRINVDKIKRYKGCKIKGCDNPHHGKGFCSIHYKRNLRGTL